MAQTLIKFDEVKKTFGRQTVLNGVSLEIAEGDITTIIGKSGMGKSVLLKHMIGLMTPDMGQISFMGKPLRKMKRSERSDFKRSISYMFQGAALFDSMTVYDNIALPLIERFRMDRKIVREKVSERMAQLDLRDIDGKYPSQISGGMKKRVALARALITDPKIILFDEPTTGLDPIRRHAVHSMIVDYQRQFGFTGIMVSHEIPEVFYISQRIIMLDEGRIVFDGEPTDIHAEKNPVVQDFISGLHTADHDNAGGASQLTGEKRFREEMARLQRFEIPFSIILLTIENLDEINTNIGYMAAQGVMRDFAAKVQNHLRIIDTCSRCGLNRFMIILSCTSLEKARLTCTRLAAELSRDEIVGIQPYPEFCFEVTAGFVEIKQESRLDDILSSADAWQNMRYTFRVC